MERLIESWTLFHHTWLAGFFMAALLGTAGVWVVAKNHLFVGAAVAQASGLGVALGVWLGFEQDLQLSLCAVALGVAAAVTAELWGDRHGYETLNSWIFLASSSAAVLLLATSPTGMEQLQRIMASSLIGATGSDALLLGLLAPPVVLWAWMNRDRLLLLSTDPEMAAATGMRTKTWTTVNGVILGIILGLAIKVAGMLFAFGLLVLPAMAAKQVSRGMRPLFLLAPGISVLAAVTGMVLCDCYDVPPAQITVAMLAGVVLIAALAGRLRGL